MAQQISAAPFLTSCSSPLCQFRLGDFEVAHRELLHTRIADLVCFLKRLVKARYASFRVPGVH